MQKNGKEESASEIIVVIHGHLRGLADDGSPFSNSALDDIKATVLAGSTPSDQSDAAFLGVKTVRYLERVGLQRAADSLLGAIISAIGRIDRAASRLGRASTQLDRVRSQVGRMGGEVIAARAPLFGEKSPKGTFRRPIPARIR